MAKSLLAESMNILEDMLKTPGTLNLNSPHREPDMPDISKIKLDEGSLGLKRINRHNDSVVKKIVKFSKNKLSSKELDFAEKRAVEHHNKGSRKRAFKKYTKMQNESQKLQKLYNLINEAQKLIDELTASGSIGVNMAGPADNGVKFPVVYKKDKKRHKKLINWLMQANGQKY